ncbi:MAG: EamA family transporter [bacterium]|nr:EamA family transporter [bacterium]
MKPGLLLLLAASIALGATGQLLFKAASVRLPAASELGLLGIAARILTTPAILGGFACFFISALLWIFALRQVPLSVAYPMVALSYIVIFIGSAVLFNESVTWRHWSGAALIVSGIVLINLKA